MPQVDKIGWGTAEKILERRFFLYVKDVYKKYFKGKLNGEEQFIIWFDKITHVKK